MSPHAKVNSPFLRALSVGAALCVMLLSGCAEPTPANTARRRTRIVVGASSSLGPVGASAAPSLALPGAPQRTLEPAPLGLAPVVDLRATLPKGVRPAAELDAKKAIRISFRPKDRANGISFDFLGWWTAIPRGGQRDEELLLAGYTVDVLENPNKVSLRVEPLEATNQMLEVRFWVEWQDGTPDSGWSTAGRVRGALFIVDD